MTHHSKQSNKAFTLIELMAATALLAMFMLAAASVTASLGRTRQNMLKDTAKSPYLQSPLQTFGRDLINARAYKINGQTLTLLGYNLLHSTQLTPLHLPAEITYTLRTTPTSRWWIRSQHAADPLATQHRLTQPLIQNIDNIRFNFESIKPNTPAPDTQPESESEVETESETEIDAETVQTPPTNTPPTDPLLTRRGFTPIPTHVQLQIQYTDNNRPTQTQSFFPRQH